MKKYARTFFLTGVSLLGLYHITTKSLGLVTFALFALVTLSSVLNLVGSLAGFFTIQKLLEEGLKDRKSEEDFKEFLDKGGMQERVPLEGETRSQWFFRTHALKSSRVYFVDSLAFALMSTACFLEFGGFEWLFITTSFVLAEVAQKLVTFYMGFPAFRKTRKAAENLGFM